MADADDLSMCAECKYMQGCMDRFDGAEFIRQQGRCRAAKAPEVCSKCGISREESTPMGSISWAWRGYKNYCPKCYNTLPPLI